MKFVLALLLMVIAAPAVSADLRKLDYQIDNVVKAIKGEDPYAVEYRKARTTYFIDVDGDGVQDAIVFFTVEGMDGGNNYAQYLTVLKGQPSGFLLLDTAIVGGGELGGASHTRPTVQDKRITIQRNEYADGDSRCCPSVKSNITFELQGSKLVEVPKRK